MDGGGEMKKRTNDLSTKGRSWSLADARESLEHLWAHVATIQREYKIWKKPMWDIVLLRRLMLDRNFVYK